jgi:hypothetical protein
MVAAGGIAVGDVACSQLEIERAREARRIAARKRFTINVLPVMSLVIGKKLDSSTRIGAGSLRQRNLQSLYICPDA